MQIYWWVYPHFATVTDDNVARLPFAPFDRQPNFLLFLSPVWDADLQMYVPNYFTNFIIGNRFAFEEALNGSFDLRVEFHGAGDFELDHFTMRGLAEMNCKMKIRHCS
jgi:hypothetical protein